MNDNDYYYIPWIEFNDSCYSDVKWMDSNDSGYLYDTNITSSDYPETSEDSVLLNTVNDGDRLRSSIIRDGDRNAVVGFCFLFGLPFHTFLIIALIKRVSKKRLYHYFIILHSLNDIVLLTSACIYIIVSI